MEVIFVEEMAGLDVCFFLGNIDIFEFFLVYKNVDVV